MPVMQVRPRQRATPEGDAVQGTRRRGKASTMGWEGERENRSERERGKRERRMKKEE